MLRPTDISPIARLVRRLDAAADGEAVGDSYGTGFESIDRFLGGGVRRGDLVILGGEVGSGKSSLALAMALRMSAAGVRTVFCTGEMTAERVMERALAIEGRVKINQLRDRAMDEFTRVAVGAAAVRLRDQLPDMETLTGGCGVAGFVQVLGRTPDVAVAFVDPLQVLPGGRRVLDEELAAIVRELKAVAVERNVALVVTAHLNQLSSKSRTDFRPTLDDFGGLGAVKQHADVVATIYREEMYNPGSGVEGATELLIRKNRNGSTGYVDLYFYKQWLRFEDMLDPDR